MVTFMIIGLEAFMTTIYNNIFTQYKPSYMYPRIVPLKSIEIVTLQSNLSSLNNGQQWQ